MQNPPQIHVFDMGWEPGGRACSRRSRDHPGLRIPHGLPAFTASNGEFRKIVESLGSIEVGSKCALGYREARREFRPMNFLPHSFAAWKTLAETSWRVRMSNFMVSRE